MPEENFTQEQIEAPISDENMFEPEEDKKLSSFQVMSLLVIGFFSLLFFILYLFPIEEVAQYYLLKSVASKGIIIDFKKLDVSLFSSQKVDTLTVQTPDNLSLKIEEVELDASLTELLENIFIGKFTINSFHLDTDKFEFTAGSIALEGKASELSKGISAINGNLKLTLTGGTILRTPDFPMLGALDKVKISTLDTELTARNGNLTFQNGILKSTIASIKFKGSIKLLDPIGNSTLSLVICPTLTKNFSNERQDIDGILKVYTEMNKSNCVNLKGTFSQPNIDMPSMNMPQPVQDTQPPVQDTQPP
jgi:hypothetical protein